MMHGQKNIKLCYSIFRLKVFGFTSTVKSSGWDYIWATADHNVKNAHCERQGGYERHDISLAYAYYMMEFGKDVSQYLWMCGLLRR